MARRRTIVKSQPFALDSPNRDEHFEQVLAELFDRVGRQIVNEFSLPLEMELSFHRKDWDGWMEMSLSGLALPRSGKRGYRDSQWEGKDGD